MPLDLSDTDSAVPDYLVGADNHNMGNTLGGSWFDPSTWEGKFENAGKFIAASVLSGADSLYNSAATVSNWFGAGMETHDTQTWISSLDNDIGQYYSENRTAADLAGFVASSFVPGLGGVKILNAGQWALRAAKFEGAVGRNISTFTHILAPQTENYVKLAGAEIQSAQSVFNSLNSNTLKALGSGLWQNTLEAAAFETAVQATMFKSPVLESQDSWDIAKNIMMGGAVGGVIGGSLEAARTLSTIKKARISEDLALKPFTARELVQPGTSPADKIILAAENRSFTPEAIPLKVPENASAVERQLADNQYANAVAAQKKKFAQIDLDNRSALHDMSTNVSKDLVNAVADTNNGIGVEQAIQRLSGAVELTAPTVVTKAEKAAIENLEPGFQSRFISIAGEDAGRVSYDLPPVLSVADRVSGKSASIEDSVRSEVKDAKFNTSTLWNPLDRNGKLSYREAELRHIWADNVGKIPENISIHANDIPLLERMYKDSRLDFKVVPDEKVSEGIKFASRQEFGRFLIQQKEDLANSLLAKRISKINPETNPIETTTAAIAKTVNVKQSWLEGTRDANSSKDLFAWQSLSQEMHDAKVASGVKNASDDVVPSYFQPTLAKINYKVTNPIASDGHILDALTFIHARQKVIQQAADNVVSKQAGNAIADRMVPIRMDDLYRSNSYGAGAGMFSSAQSAYGSLESRMQYLGGVSKDLQIAKRRQVDTAMQDTLYKLANNQRAAIEWDTINQKLGSTSEQYVFDTENHLGMGEDTLIPKKTRDAYRKAAASEDGEVGDVTLQPGAPEYIKAQNWEALAALKANQSLTATRTINNQERMAAVGKMDQKDPDVIRPIRPDPKNFPYFAFVKDPRVTGAGHSSMLFGNTEKELQDLVVKTQRDFPEFKVITKKDTADWHQAHRDYEYDRGLNENYLDTNLAAKGIYSNFYTRSDPQAIANDILQYHYRSADYEAAEIMRLKYGEAFDWLENQAQSYSQFETSKFAGGKLETIAQNEKNPYLSYIKTALNLSSTPTSNPWYSLNKFLDNQVSKFVGRARQMFDAANSPAELSSLNALMDEYGSQTAFNSASEVALLNHTAPRAELSKFVRGANAIMSRFTLGLDPLNSLNNAIGANVLRGTELSQFTRAINDGNTALAGDLAKIAKVQIPGVDDTILSPAKLMASSIARFFGPDSKTLISQYKDAGFIRNRLEQFQSMADDLTLKGTETVKDLNSRIQTAFQKAKDLADKGERLSGNNFAEEFNRFISADVMRQITDIGVKHGIINDREALTYINTFVNRVEGNILATQRPGLFQGPMGQAIGLFQSYQFNLLQQLFRYVAEGEKKDLGMLLGLQGTFYGLQGEPGFKFLNDHIVGTASGNQNHRDMYDATRGIAGKTAGDWLLYGTASNIMQTNIYSRGDINPRNLTIVPVNIADVPFVGGMAKVFGTIKDTAVKIANGGNVWESFRQGIEHNGISRPLAGLAQVSRAADNSGTVFSTSTKGTILGSNDLFSLATLSRLAGGRPIDEAIQNDTMFSINSYEAYDRAKKDVLASTIKTAMVKNKSPDADQITPFAEQYSYLGGKQGSFARYMMEQYTKANTPAAQLLARKLNNPLSYKIQALMGGEEF